MLGKWLDGIIKTQRKLPSVKVNIGRILEELAYHSLTIVLLERILQIQRFVSEFSITSMPMGLSGTMLHAITRNQLFVNP